MKLRLLLLLLTAAIGLGAQTTFVSDSVRAAELQKRSRYKLPNPAPFAETIDEADMKWLIDTLASSTMGGRETGEEGQWLAAEFIAQQFKELGLPPVADRKTYFQYIKLKRDSWKDLSFKVGSQEFKNRRDYYVFPSENKDMPSIKVDDLVFVGYGIEEDKYNDYGKIDVSGKTVVFYNGEPMDNNGKSLITGNEFRSNWALDWRRKVSLAAQKGASFVLIIDPDIAVSLKNNRRDLSTWGWQPYSGGTSAPSKPLVNNIFISQEVANALFGKKLSKVEEAIASLRNRAGFKPVKLKTNAEIHMAKESKTLEGSNVIGFIEGTDPQLRNEYVFITAHYDHLGKSDEVIYHGADDNASGTAGVIEIARAFAKAREEGAGPKRSVVCMLVSGEEKGLLGSRFYVDFPLFPLNQTVANVNIDMIGRIDERHAGNPDYIYVIGADRLSSELHEINEFSNETYTKLELDYKYNAKDDPNRYYERSDHYNFAERGIPAIFYFNGTHADYHKPTDTPDKIDHAAAAKRARLAFFTAWDIANRPARLYVDKK